MMLSYIGIAWQHFLGQLFASIQTTQNTTITNYFNLYVTSQPKAKNTI
jgi:hypothetical protein